MRGGSNALRAFAFTGPVDLSGGGRIEFDVTVDADSPSQSLPPPLHSGVTNRVVIDQSTVEAALPGSGGVISSYTDMISVLSTALSGKGAFAAQAIDNRGNVIPEIYLVGSTGSYALDGSAFIISDLSASGASGGLQETATYGTRGNSMTLGFESFKVFDGVEISFQFTLNGSTQSHLITRGFVDSVLGNGDGQVETIAQMRSLLEALIGQPGLVIEESGGSLVVRSDSDDRLNGSKSRIGFSSILVNVEPLPAFGLEDIDIVGHYDLLPAYIAAVDSMVQKAADAAAILGSKKARVELQREFASALMDAIDRGVSRLVDTDMEEVSTRLQAIEVQKQLAFQALSIANSAPKALLQLFN